MSMGRCGSGRPSANAPSSSPWVTAWNPDAWSQRICAAKSCGETVRESVNADRAGSGPTRWYSRIGRSIARDDVHAHSSATAAAAKPALHTRRATGAGHSAPMLDLFPVSARINAGELQLGGVAAGALTVEFGTPVL